VKIEKPLIGKGVSVFRHLYQIRQNRIKIATVRAGTDTRTVREREHACRWYNLSHAML